MKINDYINQTNGEFRLDGIKREVMAVTPQMAAAFLAHSTFNRPIKAQRVGAYKDRMLNESWLQDFVNIDFDWNGRLMDGHHVLTAILQSGITQSCEVRANIPPEAVNYYNQPESMRNIRDTLAFKLNGKWIADGDKKTNIILKYFMWTSCKRPTNNERVDFLLDNTDAVNGAYYKASAYKSQKMNALNDFIAAGLHIVISRGGCAAWHGFCDALLDSLEAGKNAPTNTFRRYAVADRRDGKPTQGSTGRRDIFIATLLAFNCWVEKRRIGRFGDISEIQVPVVSLEERR